MVKENSSEIGFEKQIWDAADELRGSMDAAEYKHVVLGLIFLKYLSDKFEERYNELLKEDGGRWKEDIDEYKKVNVFFVPPEARWEVIAKKAHSAENGTTIDNAMRAIEDKNPSLKGILPKTFAREELDKKKLGKKHHIIINAEGVGDSYGMAERIEKATGIETRATIIGHIQRGGSPTCRDRVYASAMGAKAVDLLCEGATNRVVGYRDGEFVDYDIQEALQMSKGIDEYMYEISKRLSRQ